MEPQGQGLAAQSAAQPQQQQGQQQSPLAGMSEQEIMQIVAEIIKLLQSGVSPDELIQKGIPPELIQLAMQQMQSGSTQSGAAQPNQPQGPVGGGLAAQQAGM